MSYCGLPNVIAAPEPQSLERQYIPRDPGSESGMTYSVSFEGSLTLLLADACE